MGCGCGGSVWTPAPVEGAQTAPAEPSGPQGVDNPATFWGGPGAAEAPSVASEPETAEQTSG